MDVLNRTLQPTRRVLGDVDPAQPLGTTSSLMGGVKGFWLPLPRFVGGSKVYDLSPYQRHGTFVGDSPTWDSIPQSLFPALKFKGVLTEGIEVPYSYADTLDAGAWTVAVYYYTTVSKPFASLSGENLPLDGNGDGDVWWQNGQPGNVNQWSFDDGATKDEINKNAATGLVTQIITTDGNEWWTYTNGELATNKSRSSGAPTEAGNGVFIGTNNRDESTSQTVLAAAIIDRHWGQDTVQSFDDQARRGFPDLLRRRSEVGLLGGGGGGTTPISGTFALTDSQEQISATGQTEVSGTLSVTDASETLTLSGATKVSGTASITEAAEQISGVGAVITTGSLSITDGGEIISAVSTLQDITGTAQITDAGAQLDATGEVKIAGTATLNDGTEEVVIIGQNDVAGSLSFADLAAEIAATGSVEVQGSLALTDAGETITARERVPARLATVDVRLEDIIIVNAKITD